MGEKLNRQIRHGGSFPLQVPHSASWAGTISGVVSKKVAPANKPDSRFLHDPSNSVLTNLDQGHQLDFSQVSDIATVQSLAA
jgi:hypothetical protein